MRRRRCIVFSSFPGVNVNARAIAPAFPSQPYEPAGSQPYATNVKSGPLTLRSRTDRMHCTALYPCGSTECCRLASIYRAKLGQQQMANDPHGLARRRLVTRPARVGCYHCYMRGHLSKLRRSDTPLLASFRGKQLLTSAADTGWCNTSKNRGLSCTADSLVSLLDLPMRRCRRGRSSLNFYRVVAAVVD